MDNTTQYTIYGILAILAAGVVRKLMKMKRSKCSGGGFSMSASDSSSTPPKADAKTALLATTPVRAFGAPHLVLQVTP